MPTLSSRRRPWPWDLRISLLQGSRVGSATQQNGMMLVPSQTTGLLVGKKQQNLGGNIPPVSTYDSAPVYKEHTFEFRPIGGMGESIQSSRTDRRYHYAINVWPTAGLFGLGPASHTVQPVTTGSIRFFVEALGRTHILALFILAGANVLERSDDSGSGQFVSRTRAGHVAMDAARYAGSYAGTVDCLYVAWDDGVLEEYNHTTATWTPCVLPAGFAPQLLCKLGDELWAADPVTCQIRKSTNDPKVAGSWSGPIQIGTQALKITALRQSNNKLCIFKGDGDIFTVDSTGNDVDLFPGLQSTVDIENGRTAVAWQGSLWFRTGGRAFWQLDVQNNFVLTAQGPGRALQNLSEVRGGVQCFAGWNSQMAFGCVYNASLNNSYLMAYGNWEPAASDVGTSFQFANQWDGALVRWKGKKATACLVSMIPSDARLYVGFDDGSYEWIKLVPYPFIPDNGAEYTLDEAYIVMPLHTDMFQADVKQLTGFSVFGTLFPDGNRVEISYRLRASTGMPSADPTGDYLTFGTSFTSNGQRIDATEPIAAAALDVKVSLSTDDITQSPVLSGIGLHERLVPSFRRDFTFSIDARDFTSRRDGASMRQSGRWLRDYVMQAASMPAMIAIEFPDEEVLDCAIFDYTERMVAHTALGGQGWAIDCQATQFGVFTLTGIIGRTRGNTIGSLRGWKISDMRRF